MKYKLNYSDVKRIEKKEKRQEKIKDILKNYVIPFILALILLPFIWAMIVVCL